MFKRSSNFFGKTILVVAILALGLLPVAVMAGGERVDGQFFIDGSTTVYPIVSVAQFQYPATIDGITYTGSSHGQISVLNDFPSGKNIDLALSSSTCGTGNERVPNPDEFTAGEYTLTGVASDFTCAQLTRTTVAKDALSIIKNNARVSSTAGCADYITRSQIRAIWQGYSYVYNGAAVPADGASRPAATNAFYTPLRYTWAQIWPACAAEPWGNDQIVPVARIHESGTRDTFNSLNGFQRNSPIGPFGKLSIYHDELLSMDPPGTLPTGGADPNGYAYACTTGGLGCTYNPPLFGIAPRQQGNSQMNAAISGNPNWLGYTSLAFTEGVSTIATRCGGTSWTCTGGVPAGSTIAPNKTNVQNLSYPLSRDLFMFTNSLSEPIAQTFATDIATSVRYQSIVANVGYVEIIPLNQNAPNWDIDLGAGNISNVFDVVVLGNEWRAICDDDPFDVENPRVRGCTRADVTFDGEVNVNDISAFGGCWNKTWGPAPVPSVPGCWDNVTGYPR